MTLVFGNMKMLWIFWDYHPQRERIQKARENDRRFDIKCCII